MGRHWNPYVPFNHIILHSNLCNETGMNFETHTQCMCVYNVQISQTITHPQYILYTIYQHSLCQITPPLCFRVAPKYTDNLHYYTAHTATVSTTCLEREWWSVLCKYSSVVRNISLPHLVNAFNLQRQSGTNWTSNSQKKNRNLTVWKCSYQVSSLFINLHLNCGKPVIYPHNISVNFKMNIYICLIQSAWSGILWNAWEFQSF